MAEELTPDICVVGGGPGGIAAARAAAAGGASVVLVERTGMGGSDARSGSLPANALLAAANVYEALRIAPALGVTGAPLQVNLPRVREHMAAVVESIAARNTPERLAVDGVRVVLGEARFQDRKTIVAGDAVIRARHFILAVGSVPAIPPIPGLDTVEAMTFADAFDLSRRPAYLLVLGAGRHALALAQACNRLGIDTAVVAETPPLPDEDPELAALVVERLRAEGIRVRTGIRVRSVVRRKGGIRVMVEEPVVSAERSLEEAIVDCSHLLVASDRVPAVEGLDLEAAGVTWDRDGIVVDVRHRTTNRDIYAIGDAIAGPALATRAEAEAARVVAAIQTPWQLTEGSVPACAATFTDPALASVGLSESAARARHQDIRVLRVPFADNDRAQIERQPAGLLKVVTTASGRILGAAIVGRDAAELIAVWALAVDRRLPVSAMAGFVAAYPSRTSLANALAARPEARLTPSWQERIMALVRRFG